MNSGNQKFEWESHDPYSDTPFSDGKDSSPDEGLLLKIDRPPATSADNTTCLTLLLLVIVILGSLIAANMSRRPKASWCLGIVVAFLVIRQVISREAPTWIRLADGRLEVWSGSLPMRRRRSCAWDRIDSLQVRVRQIRRHPNPVADLHLGLKEDPRGLTLLSGYPPHVMERLAATLAGRREEARLLPSTFLVEGVTVHEGPASLELHVDGLTLWRADTFFLLLLLVPIWGIFQMTLKTLNLPLGATGITFLPICFLLFLFLLVVGTIGNRYHAITKCTHFILDPRGISVREYSAVWSRTRRWTFSQIKSVDVFEAESRGEQETHLDVSSDAGKVTQLLTGHPAHTLTWIASLLRERPASTGTGPHAGECQICGGPMWVRLVRCRTCKTLHHQECWTYLGRCSIYACKETDFDVETPA